MASVGIDTKDIIENKAVNFTGTETILVVDDEPSLITLTSTILQESGYHTFTAKSGKEALDIIKNNSIDVLLSDVIMPEMNGYQLANIVSKKYPQIKILLSSGYSDAHNSDENDKLLHNNILQKPYTSNELLEKLHVLLKTQ